MQTDPIGYEDGMNWYAYVGNDPINISDPSGNFGIYHMIPKAPGMSSMAHANAVSGVTAAKIVAKRASMKLYVTAPGLHASFKSPSSPLEFKAGLGLTAGTTLDENGLSVDLGAEAVLEASDGNGNSGIFQLGKGSVSLSDGKISKEMEGPKVGFSSGKDNSKSLESDGIMKIGAKISFFKAEFSFDTSDMSPEY